MVDPPRQVRAAQHLQAAVVAVCAVQRHHHAAHGGVHAAVVVPVAVVLVPLPGTAVEGLLGGEFGVVVVDLAPKHVFHGVDHSPRARGQAIDTFSGVVPQRHAGALALGILAVVQARAQRWILLHRVAHQADLQGVKEPAHDDVAVAFVLGALLGVEQAGHARAPGGSVNQPVSAARRLRATGRQSRAGRVARHGPAASRPGHRADRRARRRPAAVPRSACAQRRRRPG